MNLICFGRNKRTGKRCYRVPAKKVVFWDAIAQRTRYYCSYCMSKWIREHPGAGEITKIFGENIMEQICLKLVKDDIENLIALSLYLHEHEEWLAKGEKELPEGVDAGWGVLTYIVEVAKGQGMKLEAENYHKAWGKEWGEEND